MDSLNGAAADVPRLNAEPIPRLGRTFEWLLSHLSEVATMIRLVEEFLVQGSTILTAPQLLVEVKEYQRNNNIIVPALKIAVKGIKDDDSLGAFIQRMDAAKLLDAIKYSDELVKVLLEKMDERKSGGPVTLHKVTYWTVRLVKPRAPSLALVTLTASLILLGRMMMTAVTVGWFMVIDFCLVMVCILGNTAAWVNASQ
ncbi:uncharacterized protein EHS24_002924 [Apiotrichum porosum]|uniref:Uncharacterized protein n=1 Tax=Apiotrichum porosum TaxID=105984 RepID=A0A427XG85_9TREE|nr:uncharacterized protein EHS24_002924 [Apiotrichum porosum]RSH77858.1 hypothetical protein EHS24_002924 [Apiotrichum porosum]